MYTPSSARNGNGQSGTTVVVFAGTSGIGKREFVENFARLALQAQGLPADLDDAEARKFLWNVVLEDEILKIGNGITDIPSFLEKPSMAEKALIIGDAFEKIADRLDAEGWPKYVFLQVHLSHIKRSEFAQPLDLDNFRLLLKPGNDIRIITLLDDVFKVWHVINSKEAVYPGTRLKLREILAWRSVETLQAETLAINLGKELDEPVLNYLVSVKHPFEVFYNLIFQKDPLCVYLSFPITKVRGDSALRGLVDAHREGMRALAAKYGAAAFDPVAIDDDIILQALEKTAEGEDVTVSPMLRWPLGYNPLTDGDPTPIKVPFEEAKEATQDILNSIRSRDYKLIDISTSTIAFMPHLGGLSIGVTKEISYSVGQGKRVKVFDPDAGGGETSPFDESVEVFSDAESFYQNIEAFFAASKHSAGVQ